jgi:hypothetical protein
MDDWDKESDDLRNELIVIQEVDLRTCPVCELKLESNAD